MILKFLFDIDFVGIGGLVYYFLLILLVSFSFVFSFIVVIFFIDRGDIVI